MYDISSRCFAFWLSQALSQLGSAMTAFALSLWAYSQSGRALSVSFMTLCSYLPCVAVSLFAGALVDSRCKKRILLLSDSGAAIATGVLLLLALGQGLRLWQLYLVAALLGLMNAFQGPAAAVLLGQLAPRAQLARVSGLNAFSASLTSVLSPLLATALFALGGLTAILLLDLASAILALSILLLRVPADVPPPPEGRSMAAQCAEGFRYLSSHRAIFSLLLSMAVVNLFSRLTYENILSPMLLARSGNSAATLGAVNAVMGIGGILGGILVSTGRFRCRGMEGVYLWALASFLLGDVPMALGRGAPLWALAGFAASFPVPFLNAGQLALLYRRIPEEIQGRVFAARNALQCSTIPLGLLLGGLLADYVFEPWMASGHPAARLLYPLVGSGSGSGMAVMFLCSGLLGGAFCLFCCRRAKG